MKNYLKLIGFGIALTILISIFSAAGVITGADENGMILYQIGAFLLASLLLLFYMRKKDITLQRFGFRRKRVDWRIYLIFTSIILVQPLVLGVDLSLAPSTLFLLIIQMFLVGFVEEVLFRGIYFDALRSKNPSVFIGFSAVIFGILHVASGLNPNTPTALVVLQVVNALLLGAVFAATYYVTEIIYLVAIIHALFNIFASITVEGTVLMELAAVFMIASINIGILVYFYSQKRGQSDVKKIFS